METYGGTLWSSCFGDNKCAQLRNVGISVFHVHTNALAVVRGMNQHAARKIYKVVVRDGHFKAVEA